MGYKIFLVFESFLMLFPRKVRKWFFTSLGTLGYYISSRYRKVSFDNLNFIFSNKLSEQEKTEITKYSFKNLLLNFHHVMELRHMSKDELSKIVKIQNIEAVEKVHKEGRAVIYVTTHYSSWELGGASIGAFIEPIVAVYRKMKNPTMQEWLLEGRAKFGNINLEKSKVIKPLIRYIKEKKGSGILIDTNLNKREGVEVDFMGKKISQTPTPAYLARKFNAAIIPVTIRTDDEENYTLMLFDEIKVEKTDDESADIQKATQAQADWLGSLIEKEPKFWFWIHRRFKTDYPEIYASK
ncbi:lipid A biosynthesis acyltransferase [Sulfurimonas lithotrophica]|uniref:Lipid A biosynthesis acyltransferase n=1 Tax=Sulfurimonas lithotrophica TaxID=2590022 RepID=A0A5P8NYN0_9BACT|nr:lipid A biosynthesis lauroyl acyltransferase [Sulfurimonas lithotrophica]QFR48542.1 lipid A biosynthesis acyltransferase [Sulfurimonas lithotrophica]